MFLNTEMWELLPVKPTFTTLQLNEFRFMANKGTERQNRLLFFYIYQYSVVISAGMGSFEYYVISRGGRF